MKKTIVLMVVLVISVLAEDKVKFYEPSFACSKVKGGTVEYKICTDEKLSSLDMKMNKLYIKVKESLDTDEFNKFRIEQKKWIKYRNNCKDMECIKQAYISKNNLYIKKLYLMKINIKQNDKNTTLYYTSPQKLIDDMIDVEYTSENKFCTKFIDDFKTGKDITLIKPTIVANDFNNTYVQEYMSPFPSWIESKLKERLYLSRANRRDDLVRKNSSRTDYFYTGKLIKLYDIDIDLNQSTPNTIFVFVDAFYKDEQFGLFGEKRSISNAEKIEEAEPLSIYALLDKESLSVVKFDYVSGTVNRSEKVSHIRELLKYKNRYYVLNAFYEESKKKYTRVYLNYFQKTNKTNFANVQYKKACIIKIKEEKCH